MKKNLRPDCFPKLVFLFYFYVVVVTPYQTHALVPARQALVPLSQILGPSQTVLTLHYLHSLIGYLKKNNAIIWFLKFGEESGIMLYKSNLNI